MAGARGVWPWGPRARRTLDRKVKWAETGETSKAQFLRRVPGEKAARNEWREGAREPERARELWAR